MAHFEVRGTDSAGKKIKKFIESDSVKNARAKARAQGIIPLTVIATDAQLINKAPETMKQNIGSAFKKIGFMEIQNFTRQLASLLKAHVPVVESLSALVEQVDSPKLLPILMAIRQHVKEGHSLADSFSLFPKVFDRIYINMVRAGEASGRLDAVLGRLADFGDNQVKLRNKVSGALTYPIIMVVIGVVVLLVITNFVIPQITQIFNDANKVMPLPTRIMIGASEFLQNNFWPLLIAFLFVMVMLERYVKTPKGRAKKDQTLLKLPLLGSTFTDLAVTRFCRTLGTLLKSGVPVISSLQVSRNVVNNDVFEQAIDNASIQVTEGKSLNYALKQARIFPPIVVHMVAVGEKTGELEDMLLNVADNYDQQIEARLGRLTSLLEPLMIVAMVVIVGFIVVAVLLPIFEMQNV
ncbi:MAG: type II secretion system inner membrane protein GspF [Bdellovibrionota bacterium]